MGYLQMHKQVIEYILRYWVQYGSCYGNTRKRQIWKQKQNIADSRLLFQTKAMLSN